MMKKDLEIKLEYLNSAIDLTDFNTIERGLKYHLRFELGDPYENGTKKRVNQATKRAAELFENHISENSEIYLIIYDFVDEMFARTPNHIYELLKSENIKTEQFEENLATRYFDHEDNIERVKGKLTICRAERNEIKYSEIFNGIANTEMGFSPTIHQLIYFFQPKTKKWFWMYDDRGCLMFSDRTSDLKENLEKFDSWIVENQRNEMEKQFK
ncbi:DUF3885 domain-containing protein [Flavobacterium tibetense]|uniref:DUF3885 domain-containing protein n=1 Tax=Flavobacterium tibetense TaxID=2233533 RepID=A0A365P0W3_9FLAO|nr:DUF3885 domain-containing protein [Flavobacterium tibetense]RBA28102.1 hypothetical protein DPN68_08080 [Flavobacterium tibetense]